METVIRGTAVFLFLLLVTRLSGRRTMAQVTPFDFVLLLVVAETTQQAFLGDDFSLTNSFVLIILLFSLDILLSYLKNWFPRLSLFLDGAPTGSRLSGGMDPASASTLSGWKRRSSVGRG